MSASAFATPATPERWGYLIVRRGSIELHFYPGAGQASRCFVWVDDVDALQEEWQVEPPADTPWGVRMLEIVDPSGNGSASAPARTRSSASTPCG